MEAVATQIIDSSAMARTRDPGIEAVLASTSRLREVGMADLLIAAVAERHGLTLLHYDSDFDSIAKITGQNARWVVPRGQTR